MLKPTNRVWNAGTSPVRLECACGLAWDICGRRLDDCAIGMSNLCSRGHRTGEKKGPGRAGDQFATGVCDALRWTVGVDDRRTSGSARARGTDDRT